MPKTIVKINEEITDKESLDKLINNIENFYKVIDLNKDNIFVITKDRCNHAITDNVDLAIEKITK